MPVKRRVDKRRETVSDLAWAFLNDAVPEDAPASAELWGFEYDSPAVDCKTTRELWSELGADVLARWAVEHPGTRPRLWWRYDAPEPRQRMGGTGTPLADALAYVPRREFGIPTDWLGPDDVATHRELGSPLGAAALDPADPPLYEAEAAFLDRLGLFLPGERRRLKDANFKPEKI
jgi:hypothetical protein